MLILFPHWLHCIALSVSSRGCSVCIRDFDRLSAKCFVLFGMLYMQAVWQLSITIAIVCYDTSVMWSVWFNDTVQWGWTTQTLWSTILLNCPPVGSPPETWWLGWNPLVFAPVSSICVWDYIYNSGNAQVHKLADTFAQSSSLYSTNILRVKRYCCMYTSTNELSSRTTNGADCGRQTLKTHKLAD